MKSIHSREECHFGTTFSCRYSLQTSVSNCTIRTHGFHSLTVYIDRKETHLYVPLIVITYRSESVRVFHPCSPLWSQKRDCVNERKQNQRCPASKALLTSLTSIPRIGLCSESCLKTESKKSECVRKSNTWSQRS